MKSRSNVPVGLRIAILLLLSWPVYAVGNTPYLAFSDLISGPATGLGDGLGSGVIVTVWGMNLGAEEDSTLIFKDSSGKELRPYIYYWKAADGQIPSGPANLFASHGMQEIAFSVPDSALGNAEITVSSKFGKSNSLPFLVRPGKIFHVKKSGNDANDGSWAKPWRTIDKLTSAAPAGSTTYIHDVDAGSFNNPEARAIYWNNEGASSSLDAQFAIIAYPGYQPKAIAQRAVEVFKTEGLVVSKFDLYASNYVSQDENGQPTGSPISTYGGTSALKSSKNGRSIANKMGDIPGGCASAMGGAIAGSARSLDFVSNFKALGNEIYDYGCNGSNKLHHTTYLTVRSEGKNTQVEPWEWGFNYLHGNKAKFGIHQFDQGQGCGDLTGPLKIHDNVIVDQAGAGINIGVGSDCEWSMDAYIENNVLINVGLAADWDGIDPQSSNGTEGGGISIRDSGLGLTGSMFIRDNTILGHTSDLSQADAGCLTFQGSGDQVSVIWKNNICVSKAALDFVGSGYAAENKLDNVTGSNNVWYSYDSSGDVRQPPSWDKMPVTLNPLLRRVDARIYLPSGSPANGQGVSDTVNRDVYGNERGAAQSIGAVEYAVPPPAAPSDILVK